MYEHRVYSAKSGSWLSRDPILELGGINIYQAFTANPINNTDSLGLASPGRLMSIMNDLHAIRSRVVCDCPAEAAYLGCMINELGKSLAKGGFALAVKEAVANAGAWKTMVSNAAANLDPETSKALETALDSLAQFSGEYSWDGSRQVADKWNKKRKCYNKCVDAALKPVSEALEVYEGDATVATLILFDKASNAALPLKPISQWLTMYKDAYVSASKTLDKMGLDGLEKFIEADKEGLIDNDCHDINILLQNFAAPAEAKSTCRKLLNSGRAF
jgi:hypothetical protein